MRLFTSCLALTLLLECSQAFAQSFEIIPTNSSLENWVAKLLTVDLNNDGNPELIISGSNGCYILPNIGTAFDTPVSYPTIGVDNHVFSLDAGDINLDGYLDILHSGTRTSDSNIPQVHINKANGLIEFDAQPFIDATTLGLRLGDSEGDGDLDILSTGLNGINLNQKGQKWYLGPWFPSYGSWYTYWADLDNDSQLEVVQSYGGSNFFQGNQILKNNSPVMSVQRQLNGFSIGFISDAVFADFDTDGDMDMLATNGNGVWIFRNDNGDFVDIGITFPQGYSLHAGDVNNDGHADVIISGQMTSTWMVFETAIYLNQGNGTFVKLDAGLSSYERAGAALGDVDSDGDLDILTQGGLYKTNNVSANAAPTAPSFTTENVSGSSVELSWQAGNDDTTPVQSLTYNISVRSDDGTVVVPAHALPSGKRQLYRLGNAWGALTFNLKCLQQGTYYWKVQSLDASYQGSTFSTERSFTVLHAPPIAPSNLLASPVSDEAIELNWTDQSSTEDAFIIFRNTPGSPFGYSPIDTVMANITHYMDTLYLAPETTYLYKVAASNCAYPDDRASETSATTFPQVFVASGWLNLSNVSGRMLLLGDVDNDHDLDLFLSYSGSTGTRLYRFNGVGYVDSGVEIPHRSSGAQWLDYNSDGYLDVLLFPESPSGTSVKLFKNEAGASFSEVTNANLPPLVQWQGGFSFGDYDQDGDQDFAVQVGADIHIYNSDGKGRYSRNTAITLTGHLKSSNAWADFDSDGDLDLLANREVSCTSNQVVVFERGTGGAFTAVVLSGLVGINDDFQNFTGNMEWGDYDNDGDPDILIAGQDQCGNYSGIHRVYRNNGNKIFTEVANLSKLVYEVNTQWGDYDNDGDLDIFAYGDPFDAISRHTRIYRNDGGTFKLTNIDYLGESRQYGKAVRGDIDQDGDLDYVLVEYSSINVFKNTYSEGWNRPNQPPTAPTALQSTPHNDQTVSLSWDKATDLETTQNGLTYNVYLMDETNAVIANSFSHSTGLRKVASIGNVSFGNNLTLANLNPGTYRWAVQAIDKGFSGSAFSEEQTFEIETITGIEDNRRPDIRLYPNPINKSLTIAFEAGHTVEVEVLTTVGSLVARFSPDYSGATIDLSLLPDGLYIARIYQNGNYVGVQKLIKQ